MNNKLILVEDDSFIREIYAAELNKNGFEVSAFPTGEEGLAALKTTQFDGALLDIMLPGINGLEVLKQIKADPKNKDMRVVLLTNLGQENIIKQGFELGASGYLIKSAYNPDQIVSEVKGFMYSPHKPKVS